jgi:hypothetical protein
MDTLVTPSTEQDTRRYTEKTPPDRNKLQKRDTSRIQGWGADLDPKDRPAYPMERTPPRLDNVHWEEPAQQPVRTKTHHSIERPGLTPVFGTSTPPKGLSGKLRDVAYKYSENDMRHWLILMLADRVNVGEGLLEDLAHGHVPNIYREMGGPSEWRYNRTGFIRKAVVATAVVGTAVYLLRRRR